MYHLFRVDIPEMDGDISTYPKAEDLPNIEQLSHQQSHEQVYTVYIQICILLGNCILFSNCII